MFKQSQSYAKENQSRLLVVKLKNMKMNSEGIDWKFSSKVLEKENSLMQLHYYSNVQMNADMILLFLTMAFHNGSDNKLDDLIGNCLHTIRKLQFDLVHLYYLNWEFVYREWSVVTNPISRKN